MSENVLMRDCGDTKRRADAGSFSPTVAKTAAYTITAHDAGKTFSNTGASGSVALTLPVAKEGFFFRVLKTVSAQTIVLTRIGSETVDNVAGNLTLPAGSVGLYTISSDGTNWYTDFAIQTGQTGDVTSTAAGVTTIGANKVTGAKTLPGAFYNCVIAATNGTNAVNVFGASGAPCALTVTGGFVIAQDATAGNITMQQATNTVFTAAKGTTAGLSTSMGTLTNAAYAAADVCTVKSSSAGNALVVIFFTVA